LPGCLITIDFIHDDLGVRSMTHRGAEPAPLLPRLEQTYPPIPDLSGVAWLGGVALVCYGVRIGVQVDDPAILARLAAQLPPGGEPSPSGFVDYLYSISSCAAARGRYRLHAGWRRVVDEGELDETLDALRASLESLIAVVARPWLFVHAGVVGWRGRAIVLPGRSGSGKTSLVASMVRAGAEYYSDEFAVLDESGRVHPYSRPLSIRRAGQGSPRRLCRPEDVGGRPGTTPLPVGLVAVTEHRQGARWRPRRLSRAEAVLALLDNTVPARDRPAAALRMLERATQGAVAVKSQRGEADGVVRSLLRIHDRCGLPWRSGQPRLQEGA
jgi:hypothetical protein